VLLICDDAKLNSILNELKNIPIVSDAKQVQGMYDVIVNLNATQNNVLEETIRTKIRYIDGVRSTLTLLGQQTQYHGLKK
jgi:DNA-binding Lrp family transcriptional regulator